MTLFVVGFPLDFQESDLSGLFEPFGEVGEVKIIKDRATGDSRGFGFVEMQTREAMQAICGLHEARLDGRKLAVNEARPKPQRPDRREKAGVRR